jgi:hypothetical protein
MRVWVLLLLGGGLLWLVLRNFTSSRAEEAQDAAAPAGYLTSAPDASASATTNVQRPEPVAAQPAAAGGANPMENAAAIAAPASSAAPRAAEPVPPATSRPPESSTSAAAPRSSNADDEIALASELLHRTGTLSEYLRTHPGGPSEDRRLWAQALAFAIRGDRAQARDAAQKLEGSAAVSASERELMTRVLAQQSDRPVLASVAHETPLAQAATMALLAKDGEEALQKRQSRDAAHVFSDLLLDEIHAPWKADHDTLKAWTESLRRAQVGYQWSRAGDWPALQVTVEKGDSLISIRKRVLKEHPDLLLCTGLIERVNELHGGIVHPGQVLRIPTERAHMLVALEPHWAFFMIGEHVVSAWEVGVGKAGSETRPGNYSVGEKTTEPMWFPPGQKPVPFGDPANPLGTRWIAWTSTDGAPCRLGFHGTKDPESIGQDLSQGCVRMLNRDVEELFEILPKDAAILVQP